MKWLYLVYTVNGIHSCLMSRKNNINLSFRLCHSEKFCPPNKKIKNSEVWTGIQNKEQALKASMNSVEKVQTQIWAMEKMLMTLKTDSYLWFTSKPQRKLVLSSRKLKQNYHKTQWTVWILYCKDLEMYIILAWNVTFYMVRLQRIQRHPGTCEGMVEGEANYFFFSQLILFIYLFVYLFLTLQYCICFAIHLI